MGISSRVQPVGEELWLAERAVIYVEGRMWDLNTLIPRHSGWKLKSAVGINDRGQIVAVGYFKVEGHQRTCLLTPIRHHHR